MENERTAIGSVTTADGSPGPCEPPASPCVVLILSPRAGDIGAVTPIEWDGAIIGRDPAAAIRLDDSGVSRKHASISRRPDGGHLITDLGSLNGTFVNGLRVRSAPLSDGDRLQIGTTTVLRYSARAQHDTSEIRLRQAVAAGGLGTWEWDAGSGALSLSPESERLLGLEPRPGSSAWDLLHPDDRERLAAALVRTIERPEPLRIECRVQRDDDPPRWVSLQGDAFQDGRGVAARVAGTLEDVTGRKSVEQELRRQALMFESLTDGAVVLDLTGTIADWNSSARAMFGWTREEALGRRPEVLFGSVEGAALTEAILDGVRERGRWTRELRMLAKDGRPCEVEIVAVPLAGAGGETLGIVVLHRDVGERKALEARLRLADRLGALGTMAAGMAHEVNNPLSFVIANLDYAVSALSAACAPERLGEVRTALAEAQIGAERIRALVHDLKRFSRGDSVQAPAPVCVNDAVEFALRVTANELRHRARLVKQLGDVPRVMGDEAKLGQVVVNLLLNASQAVEEGAADRNEIRINTRHDPASDRVVLEVTDTGHGIPAEVQRRVFDPFFTTRPIGQGTGLGLSICHAIVSAAGGSLAVESEAGTGATFRVSLPALPRSSGAAAAAPRPATVSGRARALVVDDEPLVAACLGRILSDRHDVTAVTSAREVLARVAGGDRFDVILCDVMMPEMNGLELHRRLLAEWPDQARRVVFMSGGAFGDLTERALAAVPNRKLPKPCAPCDLDRVISDLRATSDA